MGKGGGRSSYGWVDVSGPPTLGEEMTGRCGTGASEKTPIPLPFSDVDRCEKNTHFRAAGKHGLRRMGVFFARAGKRLLLRLAMA